MRQPTRRPARAGALQPRPDGWFLETSCFLKLSRNLSSVTLPRQPGPNLVVMSLRIIIVAALAVLLVGWMLFRHPGPARTELPPAAAMVVVPDVPTPHVTTSIAATPAQVESQQTTN